jgi:glutamine synthetase adenylyltransferase
MRMPFIWADIESFQALARMHIMRIKVEYSKVEDKSQVG